MKYIKVNVKSAYLPVSEFDKHIIMYNEDGSYYTMGKTSIKKLVDEKGEEELQRQKKYNINNSEDIDEIFALHPITNMLHCLFGYRPVSDRRYSCYKQISNIKDIAMNGFFKPSIDLERVKAEIIQATSAKFDCHSKLPYLDWIYLELFIKKKCYDKTGKYKFETLPFNELIEKIFNKISELSGYKSHNDVALKTALNIIGTSEKSTNDLIEFFEKLGFNKMKILYYWLNGSSLSINQFGYGSSLLVNMRKLDMKCINGSFYFPVSDDDIKQLAKGKLCCTYLDEGLAEVELDEYNDIKIFDNINENYFKATGCITLKDLRK